MLKFWRRNKQEPTKPEQEEVRQDTPEIEAEAERQEAEPVLEPEPEPEPELEPEPEPEPVLALAETEPEQPVKKGWLSRLREGLTKSTSKLTDGISGIFTKRKLDDEALEELEELLITADLGPVTAAKITAELARTRFGKEVSPDEVRRTLAASIAQILEPVAEPLVIDPDAKPHVILVVGVNGAGKTTTIGKMAKQFRNEGKSVIIAAGDTFRAAAVQQLQVWGERSGCPVVSKETGADAAGLAFDALERAKREKADILLIDTAGRLQNKANLMAELQKIIRVIKKMDPETPQSVLLVLDATTGQNAHSQVEVFGEMVNVTGLIVTKLDGSARGGVLVALAEKYGLPVHLIGVGESLEDMRPFEAGSFARSLMGLES
jgi:fused signal recognition particle receptor